MYCVYRETATVMVLASYEYINLPTIANSKTSGYSTEGMPRKRWIDNFKDILNRHGYGAVEATHLASECQLKLPILHLT